MYTTKKLIRTCCISFLLIHCIESVLSEFLSKMESGDESKYFGRAEYFHTIALSVSCKGSPEGKNIFKTGTSDIPLE